MKQIIENYWKKIQKVNIASNSSKLNNHFDSDILFYFIQQSGVFSRSAGCLGQSAIKTDQLKAEDKVDRAVTLTASEDRYEILT